MMRQQLKWWADSISDWLDDFGEWVQVEWFKLAMAVVVLLAFGCIISMAIDNQVVIQTRQVENQIFLSWDPPAEGALIYEIQGRQAGGKWEAVAFSTFPLFHVAIPEGALAFRVRPWTKAGPGSWSRATETFFYLIPPNIFEDDDGEKAQFTMG